MEEKPNYYAVIPANVRYDKKLKDKAKLLYGEISALSSKQGYCYASNSYFAKLYGVSATTISTLIKNLVDRGYIKSVLIYKEGTQEILNRYLKILGEGMQENLNTPLKNFKEGYLKNFKEGIKENLKDNNTSINNININTTRRNKERKSPRPSLQDVEKYVEEKKLLVNAKQFFDYFEAGDWKDAKGQIVRNWKQKILTWNKFEVKEQEKEKPKTSNPFLELWQEKGDGTNDLWGNNTSVKFD